MLQSLLADRFRLSLHREMKDLPVYTLTIGKSGAKIRELRADEPIPTYATRPRKMPSLHRARFTISFLLFGCTPIARSWTRPASRADTNTRVRGRNLIRR